MFKKEKMAKIYYFTSIFLIVGLIVSIYIFRNNGLNSMIPVTFNYVSSVEETKVDKIYSDSPIVTKEVLKDYIKTATNSVFTFRIDRLNEHEDKIRPYFSNTAWDVFWSYYEQRRADEIFENKIIRTSSIVHNGPLILGYRELAGEKQWKLGLDVKVRWDTENGSIVVDRKIQIIATQVLDGENIKGITIDSFEFR